MDNAGSVTEPEQTPASTNAVTGETTGDTAPESTTAAESAATPQTGTAAETTSSTTDTPADANNDGANTDGESAAAEPAARPTRRRSRRGTAATEQADAETTAETASPADTSVDAPVAPTAEDRAEAASAAATETSDTVATTDTTDTDAAQKPATRTRATRSRSTGTRSRKKAAATEPAEDAATDTAADSAPETAATDSSAAASAPQEPAGGETAEDRAEAATAAADDTTAETATTATTAETATTPDEDEETEGAAPAVAPSPMSLLFQAPDLDQLQEQVRARRAQAAEAAEADEDEDDTDEESGEGRGRSSRRGGRRGRGRGRGTVGSDAADTEGEDADEATGESGRSGGSDEKDADSGEVTSRRRRRRRRGDSDLELAGGEDDDPPNTVTRVRAPRSRSEAPSNKVTSVKGSTRLEAKRQRRRDSRESGRRRHGITEAEFLARRESVDRQMIVRQVEERIQIGVLEDGVLAEHFVSKTQQDSLIGNVYLGKVQNVLPSMEAAFVDIGRGRNAVLYAGEVNWNAPGLEGTPRRIEVALKSGDSVLVQVTKDPIGHKGARLTSQISLPGRFLVYVPGGSMTGISRKLPDNERARLKKILKDRLPEGAGVIVRTAAEGASEEELTNDINRLRAQWEGIQATAEAPKTLAPQMLYAEPDLTIKVVRDVFNEDFSKLIVSGEHAWDTIEAYVTYVAPDLLSRLEKWEKDEDLFTASRIDEQIAKALDRKVFLPSGGSLVIDRTEAMTVVDVNTGRFTGSGGNLEETVTKNNLEAAEEIVRQLRLRDIGGIIVIDFIDMVLEANRDLVLRRLVECLGRDRTKHQVAEVTSLGLVQMTRKRMGTGLLEVFSETCEACAGRGIITHGEPVEHRRHTGSGNGSNTNNGNGGGSNGSRQESRPAKNEKKRGRRSSDTAPEQQPAPPAAEPDAEAAERAAKARAAMGNIAKALHPTAEEAQLAGTARAHEQPDADQAAALAADAATESAGESGTGPQDGSGEHGEGETRPSRRERRRRGRGRRKKSAEGAEAGSTGGQSGEQGDDDIELTINGERVTVPHGHQPQRAGGDLTLESLTRAFDQVGGQRSDDAVAAAVQNALRAADEADDEAPENEDDETAETTTVETGTPATSSETPAAERPVDAAPAAPASPAPSTPTVEDAAFPAETPSGAPAAPAARPRRRSRRAASSGVGDASSITVVDTAASAAEPSTAVFSSGAAARPSGQVSAASPTVLGVGVSAADIARPGRSGDQQDGAASTGTSAEEAGSVE
ncbi:Rne/Rng family ribonuclease [Tersicoccus mangrovi]|uniref:Rne/Rng family ribonuclease n=1 Tax=Tersicoccus mangrovi TaxID=3121635 RepID=UPI002FE572D1